MPMQNNRREFFRINDEALVTYHRRSGRAEARDTTLEQLDTALNTAINLVWRDSPTVAEALGLLNQKLNHLQQGSLSLPPGLEPIPVNLSGSGIAFTTPERLTHGTRLALVIGLLPAHSLVEVHGQVVADSRPVPECPGRWYTQVAFDGDEAQREILIRHVVQKQQRRSHSG